MIRNIRIFFGRLQNNVGEKLAADFVEYGIQLNRVNIEAPKILDKNISKKLSEFSIINTETKTKQTMLDMQYDITHQEARRDAIKKEIEQKQENENKISSAKALLEASRLIAESKIIEAEAEKRRIEMMQELERQKVEMMQELEKQRGEIFEKYPSLLELDIRKLAKESMQNVSSTIISPEVAKQYFGFPMGNFNMDK